MKQKRIAILESRLGEQVADLVKQRGGVPFHAPALSELPDLDPQKIAALVRSLEAQPPKLVIFQTGVGTKALFAATDALKLTETFLRILDRATVAVRGPKPAGPLRARKVRIDRSAADPFTTHEVLDSIKDLELKGERVIIHRHGSANVELDQSNPDTFADVTIEARIVNSAGFPASEVEVVFSTTGGQLLSGGAVVTTNGSGVALDTLHIVGSDPDSITVTARSGSVMNCANLTAAACCSFVAFLKT